MSIGKIIRDRREELGLTQDELAPRAGISKPYLSNIETGRVKNPPTDGVLRSLERVMGFKPGQLTRLAHLERTPLDVRQRHEQLQAQLGKLRGALGELIRRAPRTADGELDVNGLAELLPDADPSSEPTAGAFVPVINNVTAGYPQQFTDLDYPTSVAEDYVRVPDLHDAQAFAARVVGDSMSPDFSEGDIVVFSPNAALRSGEDCFVRFAEDASTTFKRVYQDDAETVRLQPLNSKYPATRHRPEDITGIWPAVFRIQKLR